MRTTLVWSTVLLALTWHAVPVTPAAGQQAPPPGKAAYDRICSVCHGMEGRGDAGPGPSLVPFERDYAGLLAIVREGTGEMPPIAKERLSDDGVKQIADYLKSLTGNAH